MAGNGLDRDPPDWETLEGLARICETTKANIVKLTRSQLMANTLRPFLEWRDRAAADAQGNPGRGVDQEVIRILFIRHLAQQNSKYLKPRGGHHPLESCRSHHGVSPSATQEDYS